MSSGVTFKTPITRARPSCNELDRQWDVRVRSRTELGWGVEADIAWLCAGRVSTVKPRILIVLIVPERVSSREVLRSITDLLREFAGVLDPPGDKSLGRQLAHQLSFLVGFGHGLGQLVGIAVFQFLHCMHADFA